MDLIGEVLKNDTEALKGGEAGQNQSFKPQVNNERFSISDAVEVETPDLIGNESEVINEPLNQAPPQQQAPPEPQRQSATLFDARPPENGGAVYTDLSPEEKKRNELTAQLYVILLDTGAGFIFQLTAGDFSEASEKKFSLSKSKQKELAHAWAEVLNIEQKQTDPKSQFYKLLFAVYLPLLITAIGARVKKQKAKKLLKEKTVLEKQMEQTKTAAHKEPVVEVDKNLVKNYSSPLREEEKVIQPIIEVVEKETAITYETKSGENLPIVPKEPKKRGRSGGTKRNPKTNTFDKFYKEENGYRYWTWGAKEKIKS